MVILVAIICGTMYLVMQCGNAAFGKGIGTLMGVGVLAIPFIAIACIAAVVVIPFIFSTLPLLGFLAAICYIFTKCLGSSKSSVKS